MRLTVHLDFACTANADFYKQENIISQGMKVCLQDMTVINLPLLFSRQHKGNVTCERGAVTVVSSLSGTISIKVLGSPKAETDIRCVLA